MKYKSDKYFPPTPRFARTAVRVVSSLAELPAHADPGVIVQVLDTPDLMYIMTSSGWSRHYPYQVNVAPYA